ncbi:MAG: MG2 domain-containing protein [Akkermansia sp.]|nr:MG2 domain-containing protein [Akkermansia sp.]
MMKSFSTVLLGWIMALLPLSAEVYEGNPTATVSFPEPIVSNTVVYADEDASPQERGLNLFRIEGDAKYAPRAEWTDQDELRLHFAPGTATHATYRVILNEDVRYLSGEAPKVRQYEVRCAPSSLTGQVLPTQWGAAVLVTAESHTTQEARSLSSQSPLKLEFRQVKKGFWSNKRYYGRRVAAVVEPARVCDGVLKGTLGLLESLGCDVWSKLKTTSQLPGHVLVRPAEALPENEEWALVLLEGKGFNPGEVSCFNPKNELCSGMSVSPAAEGSSEVELRLYFAQPLRQEDVPVLFSRLHFSVDGRGDVTTSRDGFDRRLQLRDGQWLNFRYLGTLAATPLGEDLSEPQAGKTAYTGAGLVYGLRMRVSGYLPAVVDVTVPKGTAAANGAYTYRAHTHRIALNPAWPQLLPGVAQTTVLPLHAEHKLRLPSANLGVVDATLRRVSQQHLLAAYFEKPYDSRRYRIAEYEYDIESEREDLNLEDDEWAAMRRVRKARTEWKEARRKRAFWLSSAQSYPTRRYEPAQHALFRSSELVIDMDALGGGKLQPGLYMLTLHTQPNAHVKTALARNKAKPDALNFEVDIPVLITDINLICSQNGVLATRFSDSSVVSGVLSQQHWDDDARKWSVTRSALSHGVAYLKAEGQNVLVQHGQDIAVGRMPSSSRDSSALDYDGCYLFADRSVYRPGETVHLRGMVRRVKESSVSLPKITKATLKVNKPDYSDLCEQELRINEFGNFEAEVKLPDGEEDVVGTYSLELSAGDCSASLDVKCQVFRRDAFEATLSTEMDKVAPKSLTLRVKAQDYSGVPLVAAQVELNVGGDIHKLVTDAEGNAVLTLPMKPEWLQEEILEVKGHVRNDREEYVVLPEKQLEFSPADFIIRYERSRLMLKDALTKAPLAREQKVKVRLWEESVRPENPRAAFSRMQKHERTLATATVTVPADCREGIALPPDMLEALSQRDDRLRLSFSGSDTAGRESTYSCAAKDVLSRHDGMHLAIDATESGVSASFVAPRDGVVHMFVGCGSKLRHVQRAVKKGAQVLQIPLRAHEYGTVSLSMLLPDKASAQVISDSDTCFVPQRQGRLTLSLDSLAAPIRPGQTVRLSGQVQQDGKPAAAEVTLYAVDAGMLSVDKYKTPDPEHYFRARSVYTFTPWVKKDDWECETRIYKHMLSGIWRGEIPGWRTGYLSRPGGCTVSLGLMTNGLRSGSGALSGADMDAIVADGELPPWLLDDDSGVTFMAYAPPVSPCMVGEEALPEVKLRRHFEPVAVWKAALRTDAEGRFSTEARLPDTLTTYRVFAVAAGADGSRFAVAEDAFVVNLPVMITPGMPLFMSTGDSLQLPLSVTNATDEAGTWTVTMSGCDSPQQVELPAGGSATVYFNVAPTQEGECSLTWQAVGKPGTDAVQGSCKVRFPAPVLKEVHHLRLLPGEKALKLASLFAPEVAQSTRASVRVQLSASPLLHLSGALDFLMEYPYGCTEQRASALMPWLLYEELAPFCPRMAQHSPEAVREEVAKAVNLLFSRQGRDGGLGYWKKEDKGCPWASAYAAAALVMAQERGFAVPQDKLKRLLSFVDDMKEADAIFGADIMAARALGQERKLRRLLDTQWENICKQSSRPGVYGANIIFMRALMGEGDADEAFRTWLRTVGRDYRHGCTHHSAMMMLALHDFLRKSKANAAEATVVLPDSRLTVGRTPVELPLPQAARPAELPTVLSAADGAVYALVRAKAQPETADFPGVTEKGLQVTRLYEVKGEDGVWRKAPAQLSVGDVVRVTLTCAKAAEEMEYLVLEDYLPACMEAINPEVPSQAAGLEPCAWSSPFDHREYLADRVRGFCTRWAGRDLLNMTYYARVKRAGTATAPPAQAQLMYEPQVYGLSPNTKVTAH